VVGMSDLVPTLAVVNDRQHDHLSRNMGSAAVVLVRHAGALDLRLPPGHHLLATILARLRALPETS
jgi:hypothetical protein